MRITGEQIASGINKWVEEEIKGGPAREYDLGKFLFTVGTGTIGFLLVAAKLNRATAQWNLALLISLVALVLAMAVALFMVQPKKWFIEGDTDLFDKRAEIIRWTVFEARLWFVLWVVGIVAGVWGVFS